jgi:hypothetical protein
MRAALRLRWLEARRHGGGPLLLAAAAIVLLVALFGGETVDGRYGLATDLAATFTYLAAVFFGALPLAADREKKRAFLPGASPVSPPAWAVGNALGAAAVTTCAGLVLFLAAGVGAALGGGIETHETFAFGHHGTQRLPVRLKGMPADTTKLRILPRVMIRGPDRVGATDSAPVEVGGKRYDFFPDTPIVVPVEGSVVVLKNLGRDHLVGIDLRSTRALAGDHAFLLNAAAAGVPPTIGAAALAAFGAAAAANLGGGVAALLTALVLVLAAMKGFLLDTIEHEGALEQAKQDHGTVVLDEHGHEHGHAAGDSPARVAARAMVKALLGVVPDLGSLDRTDRVALGEWTALKKSGHALLFLALSLFVAAVVGGIGVHERRLP